MRNIQLLAIALVLFSCGSKKDIEAEFSFKRQTLSNNWRLVPSMENVNGKDLSTGIIPGKGDYDISVPTTVLNGLVQAGAVKNPYFGRNLESIDKKQFEKSWWYCTNFDLSDTEAKQTTRIIFDGINYSVNIWLNGELIKSKEDIYGAFNQFDLLISGKVKTGKNHLAIEVFPPSDGDFTVGFVDWAPTPPDKNMGIWRQVHLELNGPASIKNTFVRTKLKTKKLNEAELNISTEVTNHSKQEVKGIVNVKIEDIELTREVTLKPQSTQLVRFVREDYPDLRVENPRVWWPNNLGRPELYQADVSLTINDKVSGQESKTFGIRKIEDYINEQGHRGYKVNGVPVVIKGGGWVDDLLLGGTSEYNETQVKYAQDMNLNCIRFEGFWGSSEEIYDLCDKYGMLAMVGWSCHWEWSEYLGKEIPEAPEGKYFGGIITEEEQDLVAGYFEDQVKWLRNHPSIFVWGFGSDFLHRPELEKKYLKFLQKEDPDRPYLGSHKSWTSEVTGPSAVKMEGPYDWVPPVYWYSDTTRGGNFGFNTETGPGPQPPVIESMKKMLPEQNYWPIDSMWDYHSGRHAFANMDRYNKALKNRYGTFDSMEEYCKWAQVASYEAIRPMFEAFESNKPEATGVVQWMLNSAWPETFWQLYDYYLIPTGAYFGTKKACQPINLVYNYDNNKVYLVNSTQLTFNDMKLVLKGFDSNSNLKQNQTVTIDCESNSSQSVFDFNWNKFSGNLAFLKLEVYGNNDSLLSDNFYWLSRKKDVPDEYSTSSWIYTPTKEFADYSGLLNLPSSSLDVRSFRMVEGTDLTFKVTITNTSKKISFFNELKVVDEKTGDRLFKPVFWSDNYVSLLPGEQKIIKATVPGVTELRYTVDVLPINSEVVTTNGGEF